MGLLEPVGFGPDDDRVYLALLDRRRGGAADLALVLGLTVTAVGAALDRLAEAGLVSELGRAPAEYVAVPPEVGVTALVHRRRAQLAEVQVEVERIADRLRREVAGAGGRVVEVVEGEDAVVAEVSRAQARARSEVLVVDAPPYLGGVSAPNHAELGLLADGVAFRVVYAPEALENPAQAEHMHRCVLAGEQARVLPGVARKMVIVDREVAVLPLSYDEPDPARRVVVRRSSLLDVTLSCFEALWAGASPVSVRDGAGISSRDRQLLTLLSAGMADRSIARTLGVTDRTVGRRLTELMRVLGAQTRFQAGVLAARRGWI
ncbi:helix-turn-helix transcriptional regulator [Actinokineospora bangkokensis]|uniref:HTH luxR-type domain-containing protein n=1 Tax=Actinokineospora bangkokensis TaxID=1193682 RepID=A0A1Q9LNF0_9PSEU|nr:LuxR family transcriptional regulator [Actinokineospora bangkokensis]OLR93514.1 hypothetical protein BJP25_14520 [Actinokineospora bangkokensis]